MVGGLDVAAGAAQLISIADLTLTKLVPALCETPHANQNIRDLHRELQQFRDAIKEVERVFGFRSIHPGSTTLPPDRLHSLRQHLGHCRNAIEQLSQKLPQPAEGDPNWPGQFFKWLILKSNLGVISRMQENIGVMRNLLLVWISLAQVEEARESNTAHERRPSVVRSRCNDLRHDVENLERGEGPWQDAVIDDVEECLSAADTGRQTRSTTATSNNTQVDRMQRRPSRATDEQSNNDSTYGSVEANEDPELGPVKNETEQFYTSTIDSSKQEVRQLCASKRFDEAAAAQYRVLSYSREKQQFCDMKFHDERIELKLLADLHFRRAGYADAIEILLHLRSLEIENFHQVWRWDLDLANAYFAKRELQNAATYAQRAYRRRQNEPQRSHEGIIKALDLLQSIYLARGLETEARAYAREALLHALKSVGDPDERLIVAIESRGDPDAVLGLVRELQDAKEHGFVVALQAFHIAVAENRQAVAEALWNAHDLVKKNLDIPNAKGEPPLLSATGLGHSHMVKWLLGKGCNANVRKAGDVSVLMEATQVRSPEIVRMLLDKAADPHTSNKYGRTALHYAVSDPRAIRNEDCHTIIRYLLKKGGPELLEVSSAGAQQTVLHEAAEAGNLKAIELFLSKGADVEARDVNRRTPLIVAIDKGHLDAVKILLRNNANLEVKDKLGRTPQKAAKKGGGNSDKIQKLLKDYERSRSGTGGFTPQSPSQTCIQERSSSDTPSIRSSNTTYAIRSRQDDQPAFSLNQRAADPRPQLEDDGASIRSTATTWGRGVMNTLRLRSGSRDVGVS